eukprot:4052788-Amphidinium_carterae.1
MSDRWYLSMGTGYGKAQKLRYSDILIENHIACSDVAWVREWMGAANEMHSVVRANRRAMAEIPIIRHLLGELPQADEEMRALAAAFNMETAVVIMGFKKQEAGKDRWLLSPTNS